MENVKFQRPDPSLCSRSLESGAALGACAKAGREPDLKREPLPAFTGSFLALKSLIIRVSIGHSVLNAASRFDGVVSEDVPA